MEIVGNISLDSIHIEPIVRSKMTNGVQQAQEQSKQSPNEENTRERRLEQTAWCMRQRRPTVARSGPIEKRSHRHAWPGPVEKCSRRHGLRMGGSSASACVGRPTTHRRPSTSTRSTMDCGVLGGLWDRRGSNMQSTHGSDYFLHDRSAQIAADHDRMAEDDSKFDQ